METVPAEKWISEDEEELVQDFKMVTFTLEGRDYGINIMQVKEISDVERMTPVPNTAPFVMGVYSLRGEIISIIDLRLFLGLTSSQEKKDLENIIILSLGAYTFGVIVDSVERIQGGDSRQIKPPHPLFGDINTRYIEGIFESEDRLYVILAVERMFTSESEEQEQREDTTKLSLPLKEEEEEAQGRREEPAATAAPPTSEELSFAFITESLALLSGFYASAINDKWLKQRYHAWQEMRGSQGKDVQLQDAQDAADFLETFPSSCEDSQSSQERIERLAGILPQNMTGNFNVWNPGCGMGHDAYLLACLLKVRNPEINLKIRASEKDFVKIASAPSLVVEEKDLPPSFHAFLTKGGDGKVRFSREIRDHILFEYHDLANATHVSKIDLVMMQDEISFLKKERQKEILDNIAENLKNGGIVVVGDNEELPEGKLWERLAINTCKAYRKLG